MKIKNKLRIKINDKTNGSNAYQKNDNHVTESVIVKTSIQT